LIHSRKHYIVLVFIFCLTHFPAPIAQADTLETIQAAISKYLKRPGVRSAKWGIQILDPENNKVLVEVNPDKPFLPASVLKVVTTSAAVEKLGPEFRYKTGVYTNGAIDTNGVLNGDLILVGRGDPNLLDAYGDLQQKPALNDLAEKVQSLGIREVRGDIIGDDSYFDSNSTVKGWTASDLRTVYGAPVNALSINNNVVQIVVNPASYKKPVTVGLEPRTSYFRIRNSGITGGRRSKNTLRAQHLRGSNTIVISGTLPSNRTYVQNIVLSNPAETTAATFKEELQRRGIEIHGKVSAIHSGDILTEDKKNWSLVTEHQSLPLVRALEIINKRSQNLHAEMLLRTLGAEFKGEGSNEAGLEVVKEFLVQAGIDSEKIHLNDGCGLSRENFLTPRFQTSLLEYLLNRPYFGLFYNTLSVSGTDGTLRNRLSAMDVKGSIHAKTGTLNGVTTLSGYITTQSGRNLIFSIFANRVTAVTKVKRTIDEICSLFVKFY
jgi:D-alanyl-D-alanine carboxypeptidase/D-alanyl-D-alanine-endopeptidase (penicillin-binding protein 4)